MAPPAVCLMGTGASLIRGRRENAGGRILGPAASSDFQFGYNGVTVRRESFGSGPMSWLYVPKDNESYQYIAGNRDVRLSLLMPVLKV